ERRACREERQTGGKSGTTAGRQNLTLLGHHCQGLARDAEKSLFVYCGRSVTGSCLLARASVPAQRDWGAAVPSAGRANDSTKKYKMNRHPTNQRPGAAARQQDGIFSFPA
ncbi:uncharacterized protein LOC118656023, partial [Myotis myotis]|uniref:uncharacterized protein LOC118656023 n=1 Tax=Myotis myotis TaxID=51298 RepID=UPI001748B113